jgi:hypothetical protein
VEKRKVMCPNGQKMVVCDESALNVVVLSFSQKNYSLLQFQINIVRYILKEYDIFI